MISYYRRAYPVPIYIVFFLWIGLCLVTIGVAYTISNDPIISEFIKYNFHSNSYEYEISTAAGSSIYPASYYTSFYALVTIQSIIRYSFMIVFTIWSIYTMSLKRIDHDRLVIGIKALKKQLILLITIPLLVISLISIYTEHLIKITLGGTSLYTPSIIYLIICSSLLLLAYLRLQNFGDNFYNLNSTLNIIQITILVVVATGCVVLDLVGNGLISYLLLVTIVFILSFKIMTNKKMSS